MRRAWNTVGIALQTHKAFETQVVYEPRLNAFECLIFDEVPQLVYRNTRIKVWPESIGGKRPRWRCEPIDAIDTKLRTLENTKYWDQIKAIVTRLQRRRGLLIKQAQKAHDTRLGKVERMAARDVEPILDAQDFATLVRVQRAQRKQGIDLPMDGGDEYVEQETALRDEDASDDERRVQLGSLLVSIRDFCGDKPFTVYYEHTFTKKTKGAFCMYRPVDGWSDLLLNSDGSGRRVVILDATGGIDPRYLLLGASKIEMVPKASFPNATIILTSADTVTKSKVECKNVTALDIANQIATEVGPHLSQVKRLLVVTSKKMAPKVRKAVEAQVTNGTLPKETLVEHFGNLRGKNEFRDFDAACLTHLHRYNEHYYAGLKFLTEPFETFPAKWEPKNVTDKHKQRIWESSSILHRAMVCDIYQDTMRIGLRSNPDRQCLLFIPTCEPGIIVRLMRLFPDAKFVRPGEPSHGPPTEPRESLATVPERPGLTPMNPAEMPVPRQPPLPLSQANWMTIVDYSGLDHDAKGQLALLAPSALERTAVSSEWATMGWDEADDIDLAHLGEGLATRWLLEHPRPAEQPKQFDPNTVDRPTVVRNLKKWFRDERGYSGDVDWLTPEVIREEVASVSKGEPMTKRQFNQLHLGLARLCEEKMARDARVVRERTGQVAHEMERSVETQEFQATIAEILQTFSAQAHELHPGYYFGKPDFIDEELFDAVRKASIELPHYSKATVLGRAANSLILAFLTRKGFYESSTKAERAEK